MDRTWRKFPTMLKTWQKVGGNMAVTREGGGGFHRVNGKLVDLMATIHRIQA